MLVTIFNMRMQEVKATRVEHTPEGVVYKDEKGKKRTLPYDRFLYTYTRDYGVTPKERGNVVFIMTVERVPVMQFRAYEVKVSKKRGLARVIKQDGSTITVNLNSIEYKDGK